MRLTTAGCSEARGEDFVRRPVVQGLVNAAVIVEVEVPFQATIKIGSRFVVLEIDVFVFHAAPQAFDEDVIQRATATIHTDGDLILHEQRREVVARELSSLVRVEDVGAAVGRERVIERGDTELGVERV